MKKLLIFNWKMAPQSLSEAKRLLTNHQQLITNNKNTEVIICPPFVYLSELLLVMGRRSSIKLGAQDVFWENQGHYTGEISPKMLKNSGVEYVIIGHSERRKYLSETDEMINKKVKAALKEGLKAILCVGEDLSIRRRGKKAVEKFIKTQLKKDLEEASSIKHQVLRNLIVAYEPIWAIGTGRSDTPQDAVEMIRYIKRLLTTDHKLRRIKVLYGGSVDSKNIKNFVKYKEIDGFLVGHASLKPKESGKIIKVVANNEN